MSNCCKNCAHLKESKGTPEGQRFYNELRCEVFKFLFWYKDSLEGVDDIHCHSSFERK